jgi:TfoX/Sxy family transcriptional regulator of competence genes
MFGGLGFMLNGSLIAGASRRGLLVRVGKDRQAEALGRPGARLDSTRFGEAAQGHSGRLRRLSGCRSSA